MDSLRRAPQTTRYTIDLGIDIDAKLNALAAEKRTSKADIIRRAIEAYSYLVRNTDGKNTKVAIANDDDRILKEIILP